MLNCALQSGHIATMALTALSIDVLVAGVMLVTHVLVIFWALLHGARTNVDQERAAVAEDGGRMGLSAGELETLPCHDIVSSTDAGVADCAVCLEAFEAGDQCRRLPRCEHSFHAKCVGQWLGKSRCCPVCRADVVPKGELVKVVAVEPAAKGRSPAALEVLVISLIEAIVRIVVSFVRTAQSTTTKVILLIDCLVTLLHST